MRWKTAAAAALGIAALLAAAGAVALHTLADPERLKASALSHARAAWGRELLIGDASLSWFPAPAFAAAKVSFSNPSWCADPHLLQAERVRADLALWPLLAGEVRVKSLALEGVRASLEEGDDGRTSWRLRGASTRSDPPGNQARRLPASDIVLRDVAIHRRSGGRAAEPWLLQEARIRSDEGSRNVRIEARVVHHGQPLAIEAGFDDLSAAGTEGATSHGRIALRWAKTEASVEGRLPLHRSLAGGEVRVAGRSDSVQDLFAFFGIERKSTAPVAVRLEARAADGAFRVTGLDATLGKLRLTGDGTVRVRDGKPVIDARLEAGRLDWLATLVDAGGTLKPKRRDEEIFHKDPVAWRAVDALGGLDGSRAEVRIRSLRLGNGLELRDLATRVELGGDRMKLGPFTASLLGGSAKGAIELDAGKHAIHATLKAERLSLEQWFRQRGSKVPFTGGPLAVDADLRLRGDTYDALAGSLTGPLRIRMGPGRWNSKRAGEYEELMVKALAAKESSEIRFQCVAADLDFKAGRAKGERLLGAKSDVSRLVTGGEIDLREEKIDLRGTVRAAEGPSVGLAMFAGEVQIHGRLARPKMRLDPAAKPAIVARAAAAIATAGATLLGGAIVDAAGSKDDPCAKVLG